MHRAVRVLVVLVGTPIVLIVRLFQRLTGR